jgi:glycosyltransferase involved in cell wall biosynthesis
MRTRISILLPTFNSAATVRETLKSVEWADEILVVDSFSTDGTLEICKEFGARIVQHDYINSAKQKNWAVPQCAHEWVLQIDTDEVLEPGAREEIEQVLQSAPIEVDVFRFPRKNHMLGRWVKRGGIYPDYQTRLFRRDAGRWIAREVHAHVQASGEVRTLEHHILHFGMPNISKQLRNLDRYTRYEADELHKQGKQFHWTNLTIRPWLVFLDRYVRQRGFAEGWRGFILCAYIAIYDFMSQAKLWEITELDLQNSPQ